MNWGLQKFAAMLETANLRLNLCKLSDKRYCYQLTVKAKFFKQEKTKYVWAENGKNVQCWIIQHSPKFLSLPSHKDHTERPAWPNFNFKTILYKYKELISHCQIQTPALPNSVNLVKQQNHGLELIQHRFDCFRLINQMKPKYSEVFWIVLKGQMFQTMSKEQLN